LAAGLLRTGLVVVDGLGVRGFACATRSRDRPFRMYLLRMGQWVG
jgi:hypothetical protein